LQINAEALAPDVQILTDVGNVIDGQTTVAPKPR
jgi:hypothetical protein